MDKHESLGVYARRRIFSVASTLAYLLFIFWLRYDSYNTPENIRILVLFGVAFILEMLGSMARRTRHHLYEKRSAEDEEGRETPTSLAEIVLRYMVIALYVAAACCAIALFLPMLIERFAK